MGFLFWVSILLLANCGGAGEETDGDGQPVEPTLGATLSSIQANIFTPTCAVAGCHSAASASGGLVLVEGSSFGNLVDVDSTEVMLKRVLPGDPGNSYLVHKLEGTQGSVGGSGSRMPLGQSPLSDEEIQAIRDWIMNGALDN